MIKGIISFPDPVLEHFAVVFRVICIHVILSVYAKMFMVPDCIIDWHFKFL